MSTRGSHCGRTVCQQRAVDDAGESTFQAAQCLAMSLAFRTLPREVGDRARLPGGLGEGHVVDRAVEAAVAATVEAMAMRPAGGAGIGAVPLAEAKWASLG